MLWSSYLLIFFLITETDLVHSGSYRKGFSPVLESFIWLCSLPQPPFPPLRFTCIHPYDKIDPFIFTSLGAVCIAHAQCFWYIFLHNPFIKYSSYNRDITNIKHNNMIWGQSCKVMNNLVLLSKLGKSPKGFLIKYGGFVLSLLHMWSSCQRQCEFGIQLDA